MVVRSLTSVARYGAVSVVVGRGLGTELWGTLGGGLRSSTVIVVPWTVLSNSG